MAPFRVLIFLFLMLCVPAPVVAADAERSFEDELTRVDEALRSNPSKALSHTLDSCRKQRGYAVKLYQMGMETRARRALDYCVDALDIPEDVSAEEIATISEEELAAAADKEYARAMALEGNAANGLKIYRQCAACHQPEGWGKTSGTVPQISGQHHNVVIRQLADFRAGNRDSVVMLPYATSEAIGGPQAIADVAAYIDTLEISVDNGKGPGTDLEKGEQLYGDYCAECHGASGEGSNDGLVPRIQAQHYRYLVRQFEWIRDGKRRNSNPEMVAQIQGFEDHEVNALMDYVSRLEPPEELQAPPGWKNPDFD